MATEVILPKLGQTMEEGTIVEWLKEEGEEVQRGEVLFTVDRQGDAGGRVACPRLPAPDSGACRGGRVRARHSGDRHANAR